MKYRFHLILTASESTIAETIGGFNRHIKMKKKSGKMSFKLKFENTELVSV